MGDRANIIVKNEDTGQVCLYSHWGGSEIHKTLKNALIRGKDRWNDPYYLARIIFSEMIQQDLLGLTGYGLSQLPGDGRDNMIIVNVDNQTVNDNNHGEITFSDFIKD